MNFQVVMNPFQAFQELSMHIGGVVASSGPKTIEITDPKIKIAKHGFDKHSFRKSPEKRA